MRLCLSVYVSGRATSQAPSPLGGLFSLEHTHCQWLVPPPPGALVFLCVGLDVWQVWPSWLCQAPSKTSRTLGYRLLHHGMENKSGGPCSWPSDNNFDCYSAGQAKKKKPKTNKQKKSVCEHRGHLAFCQLSDPKVNVTSACSSTCVWLHLNYRELLVVNFTLNYI